MTMDQCAHVAQECRQLWQLAALQTSELYSLHRLHINAITNQQICRAAGKKFLKSDEQCRQVEQSRRAQEPLN